MNELFTQLGIDWRLLLSQVVNFLILLVVLRIFAYQPLIKILKERRERIEEGLRKADESDRRLGEIDVLAKNKIKETEKEALQILRDTEVRAKQVETELLKQAHAKEAAALQNAELIAEAKAKEARKILEKEAGVLVRNALVRTVEMKPEAVDEELVQKAVRATLAEQ
ncbi:MAG: ATP synthase F0 subunit B [Patescibacteria group bacterium]